MYRYVIVVCTAVMLTTSSFASPEADDIADKAKKTGSEAAAEIKAVDIATTTIGGLKLTISQRGELKDGEVQFEFTPEAGKGNPKGLRVWIGDEMGDGGAKKPAEAMDLSYVADVTVPSNIKGDNWLWIEFTPPGGKKSKNGIKLKR